MVVAVWSVKGGVGVTSVAALLAIGQAERAEDTVLVDLDGDVPVLLGCDDSAEAPGVAEWCAMAVPNADALARIEVLVRPSLSYVPRGSGPMHGLDHLAAVLTGSRRNVIVDCGVVRDAASLQRPLIEQATTSLLVVRECYLTLQAVQRLALPPTGVVVIKEPGRQLGRADVESAAQAPVIAEIAADEVVTTALDSGLLNARLPRRLIRSMGRVLSHAA